MLIRSISLLLTATLISISSIAQSGHLVISQVYGAGGNASALYQNDFIELYNPTPSSITFSGWSIQYTSSGTTGTWSDVIPIAATIPAGGYYLVQLFSNGAIGATLPTPDLIDTNNVNLGATAGKLALVSHTTPLSGASPTNGVIDLLGYGSANGFEGAPFSAAPTAAQALHRINNGCRDFDNNSTDFTRLTPTPRNSSTPTSLCSTTPAISTGAVTGPFCINALQGAAGTVAFTSTGSFNTTFNAYLSDANGLFGSPELIGSVLVNGINPAGLIPITIPAGKSGTPGYKVRVEAVSPAVIGSNSVFFEIVNGVFNVTGLSAVGTENTITVNWSNPANCFDELLIVAKTGSITATPTGDGSAYFPDLNFTGAGTTFDGGKVVYKGTASAQTITGLTAGVSYYFKVFTRRGTVWSSGAEISAIPYYTPQPGDILINQFSPGYNGATYEYIELVNTTNKVFDLSKLAIRYQSAAGVAGTAGGVLSGILDPHRFWLLLPTAQATITVGANNATPRDGTFNDGFAATGGQIGLVRLSDNTIIDGVAYGSITGGNYMETAAAAVPPANGGLKRVVDGRDNNNNSTDFAAVTNANISLRNRLGTTLPVSFTQFKAARKRDNVLIEFVTATEQDVSYYVVERSADNVSFESIGQLLTGIKSNANSYTYTDASPLSSICYYRIKAIETSGRVTYSAIIKVNFTAGTSSIVLLANPVNKGAVQFRLTAPAGNYQVVIVTAQGQTISNLIYQHNMNNSVYNILLPSECRGLCFLKVLGPVNEVVPFLVQ